MEAETAADAAAKLDDGDARYDAILLDIGLPDGDGREFCAKLRRDGKRMPVIMLTGADAEQDVVRGLDAGANDYVAKPFRAGELLARVRAQLRVFDNSEDAVFTIGPYMFRPSAKLLLEPARNRKIRLTEKECGILKFLYRAAGRPVPPPGAAERGVGLQQRGHHAHAGDPHLPPAPEDRAGPVPHPPAAHRGRRLPAGRPGPGRQRRPEKGQPASGGGHRGARDRHGLGPGPAEESFRPSRERFASMPGDPDQLATVLVFEDEALVAMMVADTLIEAGYHPAWTSENNGGPPPKHSGVAARAAVVDLRLADGLDGRDVVRRLRGQRCDLPVIVITGFGSHAPEADLRGLGGPTVRLCKPFDCDMLLEQIASVLCRPSAPTPPRRRAGDFS